jgi:hypothetical protein
MYVNSNFCIFYFLVFMVIWIHFSIELLTKYKIYSVSNTVKDISILVTHMR